MPATKKVLARPKRRVVAPAETRTQLRLTADSKFTRGHFSQLFAVLKIRRKNALAEPSTSRFLRLPNRNLMHPVGQPERPMELHARRSCEAFAQLNY